MKFVKSCLLSIAALGLTACDLTDFEATWRDPSAAPIELGTEHVAAFLLSSNESMRRSFEDNLAGQLNKRGVETTPGYELVSESDVTNKEEILSDLKTGTVDHAVFMRVIDRHQEANYVPGSASYSGYYNDPFLWRENGYIGPWGGLWPPYDDIGYYRVDTIVSVETLVYSVPDSKLVWTGLSKTMNPAEVDDFVKELVSGAVKEMKKTGFFPS